MWVSINPLERLMARRYQVDTVESICRFFRNARGLHLRSTCRKFVYHARQNRHDRFSSHPRRSSTFTRSDTVTRVKSFFATLRTRICKKSQHDRSCLLFRCQISRMGVQRANLTRRRRIARSTNAACAWCVSYILISQPNGTFIQNCPRETINVYRERERERERRLKVSSRDQLRGQRGLKHRAQASLIEPSHRVCFRDWCVQRLSTHWRKKKKRKKRCHGRVTHARSSRIPASFRWKGTRVFPACRRWIGEIRTHVRTLFSRGDVPLSLAAVQQRLFKEPWSSAEATAEKRFPDAVFIHTPV